MIMRIKGKKNTNNYIALLLTRVIIKYNNNRNNDKQY